MRTKYLPSIVILGWALLVMSIIIDDFSTIILFRFGFSVAETNPLYHLFGPFGFVMALTLCYLFIAWAWYYENITTIKKITNKESFYKLQDIFVFVACFILAFIVVTKISSGISNINQMVDYIKDKEHIENELLKLTNFKETQPEQYYILTQNTYKTEITNISYFNMLTIMLLSFLLFKSGYEVKPWGSG